MQKLVIGALGLLLLYFAAADTRLLDRQRRLEEKIAELERQAKAKPATAKAPAATPLEKAVAEASPLSGPTSAPAPAAPPASPPASRNVFDQAKVYVTRT